MKPETRQRMDWVPIFNLTPGMQAHERIENSVQNGTPDYTYTLDGINGWIEFKVHKPLKDPLKKIGSLRHWSGLQREWMRARYLSPTVFLFLRVGAWDFILDTRNMFNVEEMRYQDMLDSSILKVDMSRKEDLNLLDLRRKLRGDRHGN